MPRIRMNDDDRRQIGESESNRLSNHRRKRSESADRENEDHRNSDKDYFPYPNSKRHRENNNRRDSKDEKLDYSYQNVENNNYTIESSFRPAENSHGTDAFTEPKNRFTNITDFILYVENGSWSVPKNNNLLARKYIFQFNYYYETPANNVIVNLINALNGLFKAGAVPDFKLIVKVFHFLVASGDIDNAIGLLDAAKKRFPKDLDAIKDQMMGAFIHKLAYFEKRNQYEDCLKLYRQVADQQDIIDKNEVFEKLKTIIHEKLGEYIRLDDMENFQKLYCMAISCDEKIVAIDSTHETIVNKLIDYLSKGNYKKALVYYETIMTYKFCTEEELIEKIQQIKSIVISGLNYRLSLSKKKNDFLKATGYYQIACKFNLFTKEEQTYFDGIINAKKVDLEILNLSTLEEKNKTNEEKNDATLESDHDGEEKGNYYPDSSEASPQAAGNLTHSERMNNQNWHSKTEITSSPAQLMNARRWPPVNSPRNSSHQNDQRPESKDNDSNNNSHIDKLLEYCDNGNLIAALQLYYNGEESKLNSSTATQCIESAIEEKINALLKQSFSGHTNADVYFSKRSGTF